MMQQRIFLDWNAGAPLRPAAREAMLEAFDDIGNASSVHFEGRAARRRLEAARRSVAALLHADPACVVFTSGGSEANATVLDPHLSRGRQQAPAARLLVSAIEHPSVLAGGRFARDQIVPIAVDGAGRVRLDALERALAEAAAADQRAIVSLMLVNNETGVVQPVSEAAALAHSFGALLHSDAVQALGRMPLDIAALGADIITLSGHKIGGPRGVGAIVASDPSVIWRALVTGGNQEHRHRAGTENVAAIAGFAAALQHSLQESAAWAEVSRIRDWFETELRTRYSNVNVLGDDAPRIANTSAFSLAGLPAETAVIALDLEGIAVSSGSACSSGKVAPSHVAAAMGLPEPVARGAVRVSMGPTTSLEEVGRLLRALDAIATRGSIGGVAA